MLWGGRLTDGESVQIPTAEHVHVFVALGSGALEQAGELGKAMPSASPMSAPLTFTAGAEGAELLVWATEYDDRPTQRTDRSTGRARRSSTCKPREHAPARRPRAACTTSPTSAATSSGPSGSTTASSASRSSRCSRTATTRGRRTSSSTSATATASPTSTCPGLDLGEYAEVLGGHHHLAISMERGAVGGDQGPPRRSGHRVRPRRRLVAVLPRPRRRTARADQRSAAARCTASPSADRGHSARLSSCRRGSMRRTIAAMELHFATVWESIADADRRRHRPGAR